MTADTLSIPGIQMWVTGPVQYQMTYITGPITYNEPFVCIQCGAAYVAAAGSSIAGVMVQLNAGLATIPVLGEAIAGLVDLASAWYAHAALNDDGSVTLQFAQHYVGTKAGGLDITTFPWPGVNPNTWQGILAGLRAGATNLGLDQLGGKGEVTINQRIAQPSRGRSLTKSVKQAVTATRGKKDEQERLQRDPAAFFKSRQLGVIVPKDVAAFNAAVKDNLPTGQATDAVEFTDCSACKVACAGIAILAAGLTAAEIAAFTVESSFVIALADFLEIDPADALRYALGIWTAVTAGYQAIVAQICGWAGACP